MTTTDSQKNFNLDSEASFSLLPYIGLDSCCTVRILSYDSNKHLPLERAHANVAIRGVCLYQIQSVMTGQEMIPSNSMAYFTQSYRIPVLGEISAINQTVPFFPVWPWPYHETLWSEFS